MYFRSYHTTCIDSHEGQFVRRKSSSLDTRASCEELVLYGSYCYSAVMKIRRRQRSGGCTQRGNVCVQ